MDLYRIGSNSEYDIILSRIFCGSGPLGEQFGEFWVQNEVRQV